jgi:hypothetical protein
MQYAGHEWIEKDLKVQCSPLGRDVADLLGFVYRGIYHIERNVRKVEWGNDFYIKLNLDDGGSFATWDGNNLTRLVLAAHAMAIRIEIEPCNPRYMRLYFHRRRREGGIAERHPTIEQAIDQFNDEFARNIEY